MKIFKYNTYSTFVFAFLCMSIPYIKAAEAPNNKKKITKQVGEKQSLFFRLTKEKDEQHSQEKKERENQQKMLLELMKEKDKQHSQEKKERENQQKMLLELIKEKDEQHSQERKERKNQQKMLLAFMENQQKMLLELMKKKDEQHSQEKKERENQQKTLLEFMKKVNEQRIRILTNNNIRSRNNTKKVRRINRNDRRQTKINHRRIMFDEVIREINKRNMKKKEKANKKIAFGGLLSAFSVLAVVATAGIATPFLLGAGVATQVYAMVDLAEQEGLNPDEIQERIRTLYPSSDEELISDDEKELKMN